MAGVIDGCSGEWTPQSIGFDGVDDQPRRIHSASQFFEGNFTIGSPSSNSTVQRLQLPTSTHRPEHRPQRGLDPSTLVELDRLLDHAEVGSDVNGQNGIVPRSNVSALQRLTPCALRFTSSSGVWRRLFRCLATIASESQDALALNNWVH